MRICLALLLGLLATTAAVAAPVITRITLDGNRVTRDATLLRELGLAPGDPAEPARIDAARQAVLDLGLFRHVSVDTLPDGDGVALRVQVEEKRYLLPVPRIDANSDGDYSLGGQLRWSNVGGRNQTLRLQSEDGRYDDDPNRERERVTSAAWTAPYLFNDRDGLALGLRHTRRVTPRDGERFNETFDAAEMLWIRDLRDSRPRDGWTLGSGLYWQRQRAEGAVAPPSDGRALAWVAQAEFNDLRFNLYSTEGHRFRTRLEAAADGWGSDYGYTRLTADYLHARALGRTPHQTLRLLGSVGWLQDGPGSRNAFSLGGSRSLRGYPSDHLEGQRVWYAAAEYLRPLGRDWLRLLVVGEVGGTAGAVLDRRDGGPYASIGVGVRARLTWFVDIEVEAGVAYPLRGGDGLQVFAGSN